MLGHHHQGIAMSESTAHATDSFDRHLGRTLILHLHHPNLGDGLLAPVVREALTKYLALLDAGAVGDSITDSIELPSGARLDTVAFGPGI